MTGRILNSLSVIPTLLLVVLLPLQAQAGCKEKIAELDQRPEGLASTKSRHLEGYETEDDRDPIFPD